MRTSINVEVGRSALRMDRIWTIPTRFWAVLQSSYKIHERFTRLYVKRFDHGAYEPGLLLCLDTVVMPSEENDMNVDMVIWGLCRFSQSFAPGRGWEWLAFPW